MPAASFKSSSRWDGRLAGDDGWGDFDFDGLEAAPASFTESGFARDLVELVFRSCVIM